MRRPSGGWLVLGVVLLAVGAVSCGSKTGEGLTTETTSDPTLVAVATFATTGDQATVEQTADLLHRRLAAAGPAGADVVVDGDRIIVRAPASGQADADTVRRLAATGRLEFRPVLATGPPGAALDDPVDNPEGRPTNPIGDPPVAEVVLGDPLFIGGIESAEANLGPDGKWVVNPTILPGSEGIDAFNHAAALCFAKDPICPTKELALVVDDVVLSAPTMNEPSFKRDQIQISGSFTESSAKELAAILDSGALPIDLAPIGN